MFENTRCTTPADLIEFGKTTWYSVNTLLAPRTLDAFFSGDGMKTFSAEKANLQEEGVARIYTMLGGETFSAYGAVSDAQLGVLE